METDNVEKETTKIDKPVFHTSVYMSGDKQLSSKYWAIQIYTRIMSLELESLDPELEKIIEENNLLDIFLEFKNKYEITYENIKQLEMMQYTLIFTKIFNKFVKFLEINEDYKDEMRFFQEIFSHIQIFSIFLRTLRNLVLSAKKFKNILALFLTSHEFNGEQIKIVKEILINFFKEKLNEFKERSKSLQEQDAINKNEDKIKFYTKILDKFKDVFSKFYKNYEIDYSDCFKDINQLNNSEQDVENQVKPNIDCSDKVKKLRRRNAVNEELIQSFVQLIEKEKNESEKKQKDSLLSKKRENKTSLQELKEEKVEKKLNFDEFEQSNEIKLIEDHKKIKRSPKISPKKSPKVSPNKSKIRKGIMKKQSGSKYETPKTKNQVSPRNSRSKSKSKSSKKSSTPKSNRKSAKTLKFDLTRNRQLEFNPKSPIKERKKVNNIPSPNIRSKRVRKSRNLI